MPLASTLLVTIPLPEPIDAVPLLLFQAPPAGVLFKVVPWPAQKLNVPVIFDGTTFTVTTAPTAQVVPSV